MPTTRTPIRRGIKSSITQQVLTAYQRAVALYNDPRHRNESREYHDAKDQLESLLGRTSGDVGIFDTVGDDTGDAYDGWGTPKDWREAIRIRLELERLSDEGRYRHAKR
jgi:hypothetical protein